MSKSIAILMPLVVYAFRILPACSQQPFLDRAVHLSIEARELHPPSLCLLNGQLGIGTQVRSKTVTADVPMDKRRTRFSSMFLVGKGTFQLLVDNDQRGVSKVQAEKDEWYLTADYSTKPPSVTLSKEPTKYSRWSFVHPPKADDPDLYYIRNENDLGKDAWLGMGEVIKEYREDTLRAAILSFDKKTPFVIDEDSK